MRLTAKTWLFVTCFRRGFFFFLFFWQQSSASFGLPTYYLLVSSIRSGRRVFRRKRKYILDSCRWDRVVQHNVIHTHLYTQTENHRKRRRTSRPSVRPSGPVGNFHIWSRKCQKRYKYSTGINRNVLARLPCSRLHT